MIREMERFTLKDMHIEHEAGDTKFATYMEKVKLLDIDLSKAGFSLDFHSSAQSYFNT